MPRRSTLTGGYRPTNLGGFSPGPTTYSAPFGGGGLGPVLPEPLGLPPEVIGALESASVPSEVVAQQFAKEATGAGIPAAIIPKELTPQQVAAYAGRAQRLFESVPNLPGHMAGNFIFSSMPLDQAIAAARASLKASQPKSWWQHVPGAEPAGRALHAAFIAGPEWLWRHTVVDAFQELAELAGAPPNLAQKLSPGQAIMGISAQVPIALGLGGASRTRTSAAQFNVWDPDDERYPAALRTNAGAFDLIARLRLDPLMVAGQARKGIYFTTEGMGYVPQVAGAAQRVERLRAIAAVDPEQAFERARKLIEGGRFQQAARYIVGDVTTAEFARSMLGRAPMRKFVEDVASFRDNPQLAAEILKRYGSLKGGYGMRAEHAAFIEAAVRGKGHREALEAAEEAIVSLVVGKATSYTRSQMDDIVGRWNSVVGMRNDAWRKWKDLREEAFGTTRSTMVGGPRVTGTGEVGFVGAAPDEVTDEGVLAVTEIGASRERAFGGPSRSRAAEFLRSDPSAAGLVDAEFNAWDAYIDELGDELEPFLGVNYADPVARRAVIEDMVELKDELAINVPLADMPIQPLLGITMASGRPLREMRPFRAFQMLPHKSLNIHDPYWHTQVQRFARQAKMSEQDITSWIDRILKDGQTPQAMSSMVTEFTRAGYKNLGLTDDVVDEFFDRVSRNTNTVFARVGEKTFHEPLYASQALNIVQLTDPQMMRAFRRFADSKGGLARLTAQQMREGVTQVLDQANTIYKRLLVATPRTGLRLFLEGQARMLAYGLSNIYANPLTALAVFPMSVFAPGIAKKTAIKFSRKELREVAVRTGDLGMAQILYDSGLLSAGAHSKAQVLKWANMGGRWMKHNYRKAQANYINDFMLNDEFVRRVMFDGEDAARLWLASETSEAQSYIGQIRALAKGKRSPKAHADAVIAHMKQMGLMDEDIRKLVTGPNPGRVSQVTAKDLIGKEAAEITGASFFHGDENFLQKMLNAVVNRHLGAIEAIGRDYTTRRELYAEVYRRVGRAEKAGQRVDHEAVRTLLAGGVVKGKPVEHAIYSGARTDVHQKLKLLFFDLAEQSRAADMMRFIVPFGNAYQEVMSSWARIMSERPWVPHLASVMWNAADDVPGLTFTDPGSGEKMFRVPLSGWMLSFAGMEAPNLITGSVGDNTAFELQGKLEGFNMVTTGLPIPGPFAQIPKTIISKFKPSFNDMVAFLYPYGDQGVLESVQPGWLKHVASVVIPWVTRNPDSDQAYARIVSDVAVQRYYEQMQAWVAGGRQGQAPLPERLDDSEILHTASKLFAIKAAAKFFFPAAVHEVSPLKDDIAFYRFLQDANPEFADQVFLQRGGSPAFKILTESETEPVAGRPWAPPTKEARKLLITHEGFRNFVTVLGNPAWDIFHESWTGDLDSDFLQQQIASGDRRRRSMDERLRAGEVTVAWDYYFQMVDQMDKALASAGFQNYQQKGAERFAAAKNMFTERLRAAFPDWADDFERKEKNRNKEIASLAVIANMPELRRLDSVQGLREYFALRKQVNEYGQRYGIGSLTSKKAAELNASWKAGIRSIVAKHPYFTRIWGRYLERDDPFTSLNDILLRSGILRNPDVVDAMESWQKAKLQRDLQEAS